MTPFSKTFLDESLALIQKLDVSAIEAVVEGLARVREGGGRLFVLGVGGSAGHASHAVNDFRKICGFEAYTPTDNVSELTARVERRRVGHLFFGMAQRVAAAPRRRAPRLLGRRRQSREKRLGQPRSLARIGQRSGRQRLRHRRPRWRLHETSFGCLRDHPHGFTRARHPAHGGILRSGLAPSREPPQARRQGDQMGIRRGYRPLERQRQSRRRSSSSPFGGSAPAPRSKSGRPHPRRASGTSASFAGFISFTNGLRPRPAGASRTGHPRRASGTEATSGQSLDCLSTMPTKGMGNLIGMKAENPLSVSSQFLAQSIAAPQGRRVRTPIAVGIGSMRRQHCLRASSGDADPRLRPRRPPRNRQSRPRHPPRPRRRRSRRPKNPRRPRRRRRHGQRSNFRPTPPSTKPSTPSLRGSRA